MEVLLEPSAARFLQDQDDHVRSTIESKIRQLEQNPFVTPDDLSKRPFDAPPAVFRIYTDKPYWIIYWCDTAGKILQIVNIGDATEPPHLHRRK